MSNRLKTGIMAILTAVGAIGSFMSLRFARQVFLDLLSRSGSTLAHLPRPTRIAIGVSQPGALIAALVVTLVAVALAETKVSAPDNRLVIHASVLLVWVVLLALVIFGFQLSHYIPVVEIP